MKPIVKICGLSTPQTVAAALDGGANMIGFIFFAKSPRNLSFEHAASLRQAVIGRAQVVAVTVDAGDDVLDGIVQLVKPDWLQLHGHETPERIAELRKRYGLPIMKALSIRDGTDLAAIKTYKGTADRLLFDAKAPKGSEMPGGNGITFDWTLLANLEPGLDYLLSGGLNAGNVAEALRLTKAPGIDISSGVETAPGTKDVALIRGFFAAIGQA